MSQTPLFTKGQPVRVVRESHPCYGLTGWIVKPGPFTSVVGFKIGKRKRATINNDALVIVENPSSSIFQGEPLKCSKCNFEQESHPQIQSGWYAVMVDGNRSDLCPKCMGIGQTPKCRTCNRFYHEDYSACPWCQLTAEGVSHES